MKQVLFASAVALLMSATNPAFAQGKLSFKADLDGFQEVPTTSTPATGSLWIKVNSSEDAADYTLSYEGLGTSVRFAHIHFGRPGTNGGVIVFLCANIAPPVGVPSCPSNGSVTGTLDMSDVVGPSTQGISTGDFAGFVAALRNRAGYVNVHTEDFPAGEIRGNIR